MGMSDFYGERAVPRDALAGERYPLEQMAWLDSERRSR
jgi:hypothetical protein